MDNKTCELCGSPVVACETCGLEDCEGLMNAMFDNDVLTHYYCDICYEALTNAQKE